jgi:hypothetical protein
MAIHQGIGTTVSVAAAVTETNRTASAYVSLSYTAIGQLETFSDHGPEGAVVSFTPLADGLTRQLKGASNPGNITITCADDPLDTGQIAMIAAAATRRLYPMKIVAADGADSNDTDTTVYFGVRVLSAKAARGADGVSKRVFVCAIDTAEHEVRSVAVSGGS